MNRKFPAQLESQQIVAGFFKEALFLGRTVLFEEEGILAELAIVGITEESARSKEGRRKVNLRPIRIWASNGTIVAESIEAFDRLSKKGSFRCVFPHFVATWDAMYSITESGDLELVVPSLLKVMNNRALLRNEFSNLKGARTPVLVHNNGVHCEGYLEIENSSVAGLGGTLRVPTEFHLTQGAQVSGALSIGHGHLRIDGRVAHASLVSTLNQELTTFRIGMSSNSSPTSSGAEDRRKYQRVRAEELIELVSPLNPEHLISARMTDSSISGFSARLINPEDSYLLPLGCSVKVSNLNLLAEAVNFDRDVHRFRISSGDSVARIKWLQRATQAQNEATTSSSPVGRHLLDLFCESGAVAPGFLAAQSVFAREIESNLGSQVSEEPWLHRWIERTKEGETRGHISAIRLGNSFWFMADAAGSASPVPERRISKGFIPKFFKSFREYALTCAPCPRLMVTWNEGHPYWHKFETFLGGDGKRFVLADAVTSYTRFSKRTLELDSPADLKATFISASDFDEIRRVERHCEEAGFGEFLRAFDFSIEAFGSQELARTVARARCSFFRCYVLLRSPAGEWLGILSKYPLGTSPNRTPDVAWLVPLGRFAIDDADRSALHSALRIFALGRGFQLPGVLELLAESEVGRPTGLKRMKWCILHPHALGWFG